MNSGQAEIKDDIITYYHNDHLGTPMFLTDETGAIVWRREQEPFGGTSYLRGGVTENLRFPGQYYDAETGLAQNRHRDYSSRLGRYTEADPIGLSGGVNLYIYGYGNPVSNTDSTGLDPNNDVLRCHVCTHNDPVENAAGGLIVAAPLVVFASSAVLTSETATFIGMKVATSPTALRAMETLGEEVSGVSCRKVNAQKYSGLVISAQLKYPKLAGRLHDHHVDPKFLGGAINGQTSRIDAAYHQLITNAIRKEFKYGVKHGDPEYIQAAINLIYKDYPLPGRDF
jgi:RHS repeat-associated protein